MALYAKYLNDGKVESFLGIEDTTGEGYLSAVDELNSPRLNLKDNLHTDGAPNMTGNINGLATRIPNVVKHLIPVHCIVHDLQLCKLKSVKVPHPSQVNDFRIALYKFHERSYKSKTLPKF
jgi:hypothetical protein